MIVPCNRLLFWVAVVGAPFALLGAAEPSAAGWCWLAVGTLAALALGDAFAAGRGLRGIGVELPAVTRMSKDRQAKLEVRVQNQRLKAVTIRLGLGLPAEIQSSQADMVVALPAGSEWSRLDWACIPNKRGNHPIRAAYLETGSPLGFWAARKTVRLKAEMRVYPNLLSERRNLAALFLHRGDLGLHAQRQVGKGREFEKLREYVAGDGYDEIHWKATARRGRPITKVFQIEKTQEVYVVIDASRLSAREVAGRGSQVTRSSRAGVPSSSPLTPALSPSEGEREKTAGASGLRYETLPLPGEGRGEGAGNQPLSTTLERYITAALVLGLAAERQGDLFGVCLFSDRVDRFVRAKNGKAHYNACRDALYTVEPKLVTPDYDEVCTFIRLRLRRRALLVFLTALDDPVLAEGFVRNMDLVRRQHLVMVNMMRPAGVAPLFSNAEVQSVDDLYGELGGHLRWQKLRELEKLLQRRGVRFSLLENERMSAELVSQYLAVKQRQLL